jgi:hypothetical protein
VCSFSFTGEAGHAIDLERGEPDLTGPEPGNKWQFNLKGVEFPAACCVKIIRFDVGLDTPQLAAG